MNPNFERRHSTIAGPANGAGAASLAAPALNWFRRPTGLSSNQEPNLRLDERQKEHRSIASKHALERALVLMRRVIDKGRHVLHGLPSSGVPTGGLEQALAGLAHELSAEGPRLYIWVMGHPQAFHPAIETQIYLIAREAVVNALHHSRATIIETEVEYLARAVRVVVRDNGLGMDQEALRAGRASRRGLLGMRERAGNIGARLGIWSRKGAGTEVEISVPSIPAGPLEESVHSLGSPKSESVVS